MQTGQSVDEDSVVMPEVLNPDGDILTDGVQIAGDSVEGQQRQNLGLEEQFGDDPNEVAPPQDVHTQVEDAAKPEEEPEEGAFDPTEEGNLLDRAKAVGMTAQEFESLGEGAEGAVTLLERRAVDTDRQLLEQGRANLSQDGDAAQAAGQTPAPQAEQKERQPASTDEEPFSLGLAEDIFDEDTHGAFKTVEGELGKLRGDMKEILTLLAVSEREKFNAELNSMLSQLPAHQQAVFGAGPTESLMEGSPEARARDSLKFDIIAMQDGYASQGQKLSRQQAFKKAVAVLTIDQQRQQTQKDMAANAKKKKRGVMGRTGRRRRRTSPKKTAANAAKTYQERAAEIGVDL
jgi:hypothetical protein